MTKVCDENWLSVIGALEERGEMQPLVNLLTKTGIIPKWVGADLIRAIDDRRLPKQRQTEKKARLEKTALFALHLYEIGRKKGESRERGITRVLRELQRKKRKTVCPRVTRWLALHCVSEGCSGRPSRSSPQEDEPWGILPIFS